MTFTKKKAVKAWAKILKYTHRGKNKICLFSLPKPHKLKTKEEDVGYERLLSDAKEVLLLLFCKSSEEDLD